MSRRSTVLALTIALLAIPTAASTSIAATPTCGGLKATLVGDNKANVIVGTPERDVIVAKGGADTIHGRGGNDVICGGAGADIVSGGGGKDRIFGGRGPDLLRGNRGYDLLNGGRGADTCLAGRDGAKSVSCQSTEFLVKTADLSVEVTGGHGAYDYYSFYVRVTNNGPSPISYALTVDIEEFGIICFGFDGYAPFSGGTLSPGQQGSEQLPFQCKLLSPAQPAPWVSAKATVTTVAGTGIDPTPGNNSATKKVFWEF